MLPVFNLQIIYHHISMIKKYLLTLKYLPGIVLSICLSGVLFINPALAVVDNSVAYNVVLSDTDTTGYGLDGRDFSIAWTPSSTTPAGYTFTRIYLTSSTVALTTANIDTTGCGGSACMPVGMFNQFSMSSHTIPQFMQTDSAGVAVTTTVSYVAWVYVSSTTPYLASSTAVNYANKYDVVADTNAPMIDHLSNFGAKSSTNASVYAMVFDDQTSLEAFANTGDAGNEYFRLYYTSTTGWNSNVYIDGATVAGGGGLFLFTVTAGNVPAAGGYVKYFLVARDSSSNTRLFCANPTATTTAACQTSPFIMNTVDISGNGRSISGNISSGGSNLVGAKVYAQGWGGALVSTDADGNYTITGLPNNNSFEIVAMKEGHMKNMRHEIVSTSDKTGVNLILNTGTMGFYGGGEMGGMGGSPHVRFTGPPEGMQGAPISDSIRVGFDQPMDSTSITDTDPTNNGSNIYLMKTANGAKVAGSVAYCESNSSPGCSSLAAMDTNTVLFVPSANLATSTQYTMVITEGVKGQSGRTVEGNRPGGGHTFSFSTVGNMFTDFGAIQAQYGTGGAYMPPYVKSMAPAPGMNVAPNVSIQLEFNEAMDSTTISSNNITLTKVGGSAQSITVSLDSTQKRFVTLTHSALSAGEYEVEVRGAVSNVSGIPMRYPTSSAAFSSRFNISGSSDATAPTVYSALADNSTGLATNYVFEFGASEQVAVDTVNTTNISLYRGATAESITVRYEPSSNKILVAPANSLSASTVYTLTLGYGITDLAGNGIATSTYTYTTGVSDAEKPALKEARCDDFRCVMTFTEPMVRDAQAESKWTNSVINPSNYTVQRIVNGDVAATITVTGKPMNYDAMNYTATVEGVAGLAAGDNYRVTVNANVMDMSENTIITAGSANVYNGKVESSQTYGCMGGGGMFAPPTTGMMGGGPIGGAEFTPVGFGSFTADQFGMGQADMAYPFNPMASADSNVFQIKFTPGVVLAADDQVVLTFPNGTNVASAAFDTQSPFYNDYNQFMAGTVSGTAITSSTSTNTVTITLGVNGTPVVNDPITIDLRKITNPAIPKGPATGGYTLTIKVLRGGQTLATKTSMPYYIMAGGTNTLVVDVVAGTTTTAPTNGANGTVYLHGGGPGGPMDKVLTMTNGDISAVDGTAGTSITYSNLPDGCYGVGTEPYITLGAADYYGQMSPEPVCLFSGQTKTKWMVLLPTSAGLGSVPVTVKFVDSNGDPFVFGGKDIDIFAGGPGKFAVKTLTGVTTAEAAGYQINLNANGQWNLGMGPATPKGASGGMPQSLGVMPPPPIQLQVSGLPDSGAVGLAMGATPPKVSFNNTTDVVTFTFATASLTVTGTAMDASGNTLANVEVFMNQQGYGTPVFTQTNASGTFSLAVSDYGSYQIGAHKAGMPDVVKSLTIKNESGAKWYVDGKNITGNLVLRMKKASYSISGKVMDSSSNSIGYAPVFATDANGNTVFGQSTSDGSYTVFVENGTWSVRAEPPSSKTDTCGSFTKTVTVAGASQSSQNLTPSTSTCYTLSGTITAGTALTNAPVFIEQWNTTGNFPIAGGVKKGSSTDSLGAYSVNVAAGTYRIGTFHPDYGELSDTVTVSANTTKNISVTTSTVSFTFTGGTAAMDAFIELKNAADKTKTITKQQNGLNGTASLYVSSGSTYGYFIDVFGIGKFSGSIAAGGSSAINLGLSTNGFVNVTGTVYDNSGNTKAGALVTFSSASTTITAVTNDSGQYDINLKVGSYAVTDALAGFVPTQSANTSFTTSTGGYDFGTAAGGTDPNGQAALTAAPYTIEGVVSKSGGGALTDGFVWATNATGTVVAAQLSPTDGSYTLPVTSGVWTLYGVGPLHAQTTSSLGALTVTGNMTGKNFALTADTGNMPTSTSGIVSASTGGSINDTSASGIKVTAGAGVLDTSSSDVTLNLEKSYSAPDTATYQALDNTTFGISASGDATIKDLNGYAEIKIDYTALLTALPGNVTEGDLQLAYYSPERNEYVPVEGGFTVDPTNNTISGLVNHFTDFVVVYRNTLNTAYGVTVTEGDTTAVTEGGTTDTYTMVLTAAPSADVTITPSVSGGKVTVSPSSLTFTTGNYSTPQTVTVTAVDDVTIEGTHTDTIAHAISSVDTNYSPISVGSVTVYITDNDGAVPGGSTGGSASSADYTPPTNTSIKINNNATTTSSVAVTLKIGATDATQMLISSTSTFLGSAWQTYATSQTWTLSTGDGVKTVYAEFKDTVGNISTAVSDAIELVGSSTSTTETPAAPAVVDAATQARLDTLSTIGQAVNNLVKLADDGNAKTQEDSAVYYIGADGKRHAFPNAQAYFTWYPDFSTVLVIDAAALAKIPLGANVTYKPGEKMAKFVTWPKVYAVAKGGVLRWIKTEAIATELYGLTWNKKIDDINDAFYINYTFGADINGLSDFDPSLVEATVAHPSDSM
jgi:hypothetical protein